MADKTLDMNQGRTAEFERSNTLEDLLTEVNGAIEGILPPPYEAPKHPVVLIMGNPRSGTTLTSQWLSTLGSFAYPSNLAARFYANPYMGARIQQILADADQGNQMGLQQELEFASALGKTEGALAPSEFWYFWRQFFHFGEIQKLTDDQLAAADGAGFLSGLAGLEAAFGKPVVLKGMIMTWHIRYLDQLLDKAVFLNVERDEFHNAQSLYFARQRFFGDLSRWYSFKPPEYEALCHEDPLTQLAGQVIYTRKATREGLAGVADDRKLTFRYEDFCKDPAAIYEALRDRMAAQGFDLPATYEGPSAFDVTNKVKISAQEETTIRAGLDRYTSEISQ